MGNGTETVGPILTPAKDASCFGPNPAARLQQLLSCVWVGRWGMEGIPLERFGILGWTGFQIV